MANPKCNLKTSPLTKNILSKNLVTLSNGTNLVLTDEHKSRVDVKALQGNKQNYRIKRAENPLVFLETKINVRPYGKLGDANFTQSIYERLAKIHIKDSLKIQSYAWPILSNGESLIIVNSPKSGKTMCYLPTVCEYALYDDNSFIDHMLSPIALILAPTASDVDVIYNALSKLDLEKHLRITRAHQWFNKPVEMSNGWDIIIATPMVFSKLLAWDTVTSIKMLNILVLDNVDLKCQYIQSILNMCDVRLKKGQIQLVITSEHFTHLHKVFVNRYKTSLLIGNHLESAIYGDVQFVFKVLHKDKKLTEVQSFLDSTHCKKLVIMCKNKVEVNKVANFIALSSVPVLSVHESSEHTLIDQTYTEWNNRQKAILICSDQVLSDLDVTDANNIIHFSLPTTWSGFTHRYSCLLKSIKDKTKIQALHLLDEDSVKQFPRIISFIERLGQTVDATLKSAVDKEVEKLECEKASSGIDLCDKLLLLGHCDSLNSCMNRHKVTLYDKPREHLPLSGDIKFKILQIVDVDVYKVLIVGTRKHGQKQWQVVEMDTLTSAMCSLYYNNLKTTAIAAQIKIGHVCAVEMGANTYERCEIKRVYDTVKGNITVSTVNVDLIDCGLKLDRIEAYRLLELPEHLKAPSPIATIRLVNIKPHDDYQWCEMANHTIKKILCLPISDDEYFTSSIVFVMQNTLWVHDICKGRILSGVEILTMSLRRQIFDNDIGIPNKGHVERLKSFYNEIKMYCKNDDTKEVVKVQEKAETKVSVVQTNSKAPSGSASVLERFLKWAKHTPSEVKVVANVKAIELKKGQTYEAYLTVALNTNDNLTFYIQLNENINSFNKLVSDIQEHMTSNTVVLKDAQVGDYCLVNFEDKYNRAKILQIDDDGYSVYFIDYGDSDFVKDIYVIDPVFLKLEQQAVKCKLHDIVIDITVIEDVVGMLYEHSGTTWSVYISDIINDVYSVSIEKDNEGKRINLNNLTSRYCKKADELFQVCTSSKKDITSIWNILAGLDDDNDCPEQVFADLNELMQLYGTPVTQAKIIELDDDEAPKTSMQVQQVQPKVSPQIFPTTLTKLTPISFTPNVIWSQNEIELMLKVQIPDVDTYSLQVTNRQIFFATTIRNGNAYELSINLFGPIVPCFTKHKALGPYVYIVCSKLLPRYWSNLYLGSHKLKFVTHDHDWKVFDFNDHSKFRNKKVIDMDEIDPLDQDDAEHDSDELELESDDDNELLDMMD